VRPKKQALTKDRLLYGLSFPVSEAVQKDDFVIPVRYLQSLALLFLY
jgi:hypothetical protein